MILRKSFFPLLFLLTGLLFFSACNDNVTEPAINPVIIPDISATIN